MHSGLSKMQIVRGKLWDRNNSADVRATDYYGILGVNDANGLGKEYTLDQAYAVVNTEVPNGLKCNENIGNERYGMRAGNFRGNGRRKCTIDANASELAYFGSTGNPAGTFQDIDDYNGDSDTVRDGGRVFIVETKVDYIAYSAFKSLLVANPHLHMELNSTNTRLENKSYVLSDNNSSSNIKRIIVSVHRAGSGGDKQEFITQYVYYATNIGLTKPLIKINN